ncbi:vitamin K epoxide reductase family protein [Crocosphaera sp. XPORK-15E]|uniref:vitamin K epoxide reductase family protein n=1 Tax=Crocosphaera sp. XPORK-15E TaxID=3110247 RepID=UPI002B1F18F6|nr:vitamin K epoxide reductase family protein [Crocosphaera sp. XPORK-15E]MEA5534116.1 vitamin K epoxide reductase family protein [Crocosphaera sp. XPORK-15E]
MSRRRSVPWIYRWSRPIIGAIAIAGAILTAYLTITKLSGGEVACGAGDAKNFVSGCKSVLDSPYALVFGLPLSLFGCLAYSSMATAALGPLLVKPESNKSFRKQLDEWTWLFLLAGGTSMAVFSGYLMYILATELQSVCYYCMGSAAFSLSLMGLSIFGREWEEVGQLFFIPIVVAMITLVGTLGIYANIDGPTAEGRLPIETTTTAPQPPDGWKITTESGEAEIALAQNLTKVGGKMYGAFWCPHCYEQKQLLGEAAVEEITYIECDPRGKNPQPDACAAAKIESFPTWDIKGERLSGAQLPEKLAKVSGYTGPTNFKYTMPGR